MLNKIQLTLLFVLSVLNLSAQERATSLDGDVKLLIASDLGRNGHYQQRPVAALMGEIAEAIHPDAVLALGDTHHYMGIQSTADPLWMTNFETIYSHPELQIPWYAVLGNHEYRGNSQAVLDYAAVSRRWAMPDRYYVHTFSQAGVSVRVIFIDTTPLIDKYFNDTTDFYDASLQDREKQLAWLDSVLSDTTARDTWTIVVGHHPIYGQTPKSAEERLDMQSRVDSLLRRAGVDMYICGHIHNFQHISPADSKIDYVVNSSGSLARTKVKPTDGTKFCSGEEGISVLTATANELTLSMIERNGKIIHTVRRTK